MTQVVRHLLQLPLMGLAVLAMLAGHASAQQSAVVPDRYEPVPPQFKQDTKDVGITEHLGKKLPMDINFTDSSGREAKLSEFFNRGRPVILQLGYFNCPNICDVVSQEIMNSVKNLKLQMGTDYDVMYVSVNPKERWELGQEKKSNYVEDFGQRGAVSGWHFLVGQDLAIAQLTKAVGFGYRKVEGKDEWSHPPMIVILTADGRISRYFYNNTYPSDQVRISLVEAGEGKVGSYIEQVLVALCYHFDGYSGKYTFAYMTLMRAGGIFTVFVVLIVLGRLWIRDAMKPNIVVSR